MIIEIKKFVEHTNRTFDLKEDGVTLLHGISGSGKSTLLQAIYWCLYGGSTAGKKYDVTIKHRGATIRRYSKPDTVSFTDAEGVEVSGDVARERIKQIFGDQHLFEGCCFLRQGYIPLMTSSNKELLFYLSKITFYAKGDVLDPMVVIEAIKKRIVREETAYKEQLTIYTAALDRYKLRKEKRPLNTAAKGLTVDEVKGTLGRIDADLIALHRKNWEYEKTLETHERLKKESSVLVAEEQTLETRIRTLGTGGIRIEDRDDVQNAHREATKRLQGLKLTIKGEKDRLSKSQTELASKAKLIANEKAWAEKVALKVRIVEKGLSMPHSFGQNDLYVIQKQWEEYNAANKICSMFGIQYSQTSMSEARTAATDALSYYTLLNRYGKYVKLKTELDNIVSHDLKALEEHYSNLKLSLDSLACPHCHGRVRYDHGVLAAIDTNLTNTRVEDVKIAEKTLRDAQKTIGARQQLVVQLGEYRDVEGFVESEQMPQDRAEALLRSLRNIKFVNRPSFSLDDAKLLLSYHSNKTVEPINRLDRTFEQLESDTHLIIERLRTLEGEEERLIAELTTHQNRLQEIEKLVSLQSRASTLSTTINNKTAELDTIVTLLSQNPANELEDASKRRTATQQLLDDVVYATTMAEEATELKRLYGTTTTLKTAYIDSSLLYRHATQRYYSKLKRTIDRLNTEIQKQIKDLFTYPMCVRFLANIVTTKTDYSISLSLEVIRRGTEARVNKDTEICSGERERIAIVLMVALAKLHNSPLFLLDEAMARIESNRRDICIELLRQSLPHRIIVCAEHHAEEAMYDNNILISAGQ